MFTNVKEMPTQLNALSMSDEDLLNMSPQEFLEKNSKREEVTEENNEEEEVESVNEDEEEESQLEQDYEDEEENERSPEPIYQEIPQENLNTDTEEKEEEEETTSDHINYRAEYEKLFSPLKAAKREIRVKSADDARKLMQMGVDYQLKMEALKPRLRIMRALEKNNLLTEDKINFLIDLDKNNPEAVRKFLKEKQIDPMDLDLNDETEYKPKSYAPSEREQAVDDVLDDIRSTDSFNRTIDELGNKWDADSKQILIEQPQLIKMINEQVGLGIYDQIMNTVASERMMGRLQGLNDLLAYKAVGDALQASGAFNHLKNESKPKHNSSHDRNLKARKKAASPTKKTSSKPGSKDFNPLALSDEEFEKMSAIGFN